MDLLLAVYLLVASVDPLVVLFYGEGYISASTIAFDSKHSERATHFTGLHSQEHLSQYVPENRTFSWGRLEAEVRAAAEGDPHGELARALPAEARAGGFKPWLKKRLKELMVFLVRSGQDKFLRKPGCFNPLAMDLLIDSAFDIWILEVNSYPWMSWETQWGRRWMWSLLDEMLDIQLEVARKQRAGESLAELKSPRGWETVINEAAGYSFTEEGSCP